MQISRSLKTFCFGLLICTAFPGCNSARSGLLDNPAEEVADLSAKVDLARDLFTPNPVLPDVHVVITADNAYAFGWGDTAQVNKLNGRPSTRVAGDIFNCPIGTGPEEYDIPAKEAPESVYVYIIAWADDATTQGVIGQFDRGGQPIYTGQGEWEVCATGRAYDSSVAGGGPPVAVVNEEITRCNDGLGTASQTSVGWVNTMGARTPGAIGKLAVGEDNNSSAGEFPIVCQKDLAGKRGVDAASRWMWYSPDGTDPFRYRGGVNPTRAFLIFRLPSRVIIIG